MKVKYSKYIKPYLSAFILGPIFMIIEVIGEAWMPALLQKIIDEGVTKGAGVSYIIGIGAVMVVTALLMMAGGVGGAYFAIKTSSGFANDLRKDMFNNMQSLPISYFDSHTHGELMSYYTNDVDAVREMLHHSITQILISTISLVGIMAMMIVLSLKLCIIMAVMGICIFFVVKTIGKKSGKNFKRQQKAVAEVNGYIEEMMEGQKVVKAFNHEDVVKHDFSVMNDELCEVGTKANTYSNIIGTIMNNLSHIFYAITTTVGVMIMTVSETGVLVAFLSYISKVHSTKMTK